MNKIARQRSKEQARRFVFEYLSQKSCADCGESDIEVLTFDHVRGQKEWNIADMVQHGYALKTIASEIEKTDDEAGTKTTGSARFDKLWPSE